MTPHSRPIVVSLIVAALGLMALPFVTDEYGRHLLILCFLYAIVASNWDLSLGYAGILNFAHPAFFALGVYGYAIAAKVLGLDPWFALLVAGAVAALAAAVISLSVLRLRGIYVILVSFAFGQICLQIILSQSQITGGSRGMVLLPGFELFGHEFARDGRMSYYYMTLALLGASTAYLLWLVRSSFGLSIQALRDNENYAVSRGISVARQRILTLVASAVFTGMAGGIYAAYLRVASPEVFGFGFLVIVLSALLLGGAATIVGPVAAALLLTLFTEWMSDYGPWRFLVLAVLIVAVLRFYPGGLFSLFAWILESAGLRRRPVDDPDAAAQNSGRQP